MRTIIAMTGASGSAIGVEFIKNCPGEKFLIVTRWGKSVLHQETGLTVDDLAPYVTKIFSSDDLNSPIASGSNYFDQFVVVPCSMVTLARIANGLGENLVSRVGEIALKENRRMLLAIRETPLSAIALENALKLSRLGVTIMPLSPAFYMKPKTVEETTKLFVDHMMTTLSIPVKTGWRNQEL
ncbi:MAG: UbiX family flavin prenyltransferase [Elusimicrobiota bacterium]